jgi:magnesium-transporting ATPase (P-type)
MASSAESVPTPLSKEIDRFIKIVSSIAVCIGILFFILGILFDYDYITNIIFVIGIIVSNVPEGLLATITVTLTLTS